MELDKNGKQKKALDLAGGSRVEKQLVKPKGCATARVKARGQKGKGKGCRHKPHPCNTVLFLAGFAA